MYRVHLKSQKDHVRKKENQRHQLGATEKTDTHACSKRDWISSLKKRDWIGKKALFCNTAIPTPFDPIHAVLHTNSSRAAFGDEPYTPMWSAGTPHCTPSFRHMGWPMVRNFFSRPIFGRFSVWFSSGFSGFRVFVRFLLVFVNCLV
jgi:hypothetical protein